MKWFGRKPTTKIGGQKLIINNYLELQSQIKSRSESRMNQSDNRDDNDYDLGLIETFRTTSL